ncbi:unnamed protein product [Boreogadus saida]
MNCDMLPAAGCREAPPPRSTTARQRAAGRWSLAPAAGSVRFCLLQIDVEVEEPETSDNPTKSFVIHYIVWSLAADGPPPRLQEAVISADRCRGGGKQGSSGIHSRPTIPFSSMSLFMYFRESKPKFLSPNSFSGRGSEAHWVMTHHPTLMTIAFVVLISREIVRQDVEVA